MNIVNFLSPTFWILSHLKKKRISIIRHQNFIKANTVSLVIYPIVESDSGINGYKFSITTKFAIKLLEYLERGKIDQTRIKFESIIEPPISKSKLSEIVKNQQTWYALANCE